MRRQHLPLVAIPAALTALLAADTAHAASTCTVPAEGDPDEAGQLLRECVEEVNEGFADTIDFAVPQTYELDKPLVLERDVTINGAGQKLSPKLSFSGGDSLIVVGGAGSVTADLIGLELSSSGLVHVRGLLVGQGHSAFLDGVDIVGFKLSGDDGAGVYGEPGSTTVITNGVIGSNWADNGGAVYIDDAKVVIDNTTLSSNRGDEGGALATVSKATVTVLDSVFFLNRAFIDGGGVHIGSGAASVNITDTVFNLNEADDDGGGFFGGGDFVRCTFKWNYAHDSGGGGVLGPESYVRDSTFFENEGYRGGGLAILVDGSHDMAVIGTTFQGNHANKHASSQNQPTGGGLYVNRTSGTTPGVVTVTNSTFSANSSLGSVATYGGGFGVAMVEAKLSHVTFFDNDAVFGGAIQTSSSPSTDLELESSIVAGSATDACLINSSFTEDTSLDDDGSCNVTYDSIDPLLAPLADNGGPTKTHVPSASEVLDAATCYAAVDQRGIARPSSNCDIGSVEQ